MTYDDPYDNDQDRKVWSAPDPAGGDDDKWFCDSTEYPSKEAVNEAAKRDSDSSDLEGGGPPF